MFYSGCGEVMDSLGELTGHYWSEPLRIQTGGGGKTNDLEQPDTFFLQPLNTEMIT